MEDYLNMKTVLINGSPRIGNTKAALEALKKGIAGEVELINVAEKRVEPCIACDRCLSNGGDCFMKDDTKKIIDAIYEADVVIFGTPVYWWGVSAQTKLVIDKLYSKAELLKETAKKIGVIAIGEAGISDMQYQLISKQFKCICDYLNSELIIDEPISAGAPDDLKKNSDKLKELEDLGKKIG